MFSSEGWNQMAAINLLLVNEKLKDDINDDHSIKAHLAQIVLGEKICGAVRKYPEMAASIARGYEEIYGLEKRSESVLLI